MASPNSENESEGVSKDVGVDTFLKIVNVTTTIRKTWL